VAGDGQSHNIYVRNYAKFIFRYNYSHGAVIGHIVKSRAADNYIYDNRVSNECSDGGFNQAISLTCSGAPAQSTCTVTPSSVTPSGTGVSTVAVSVSTTARSGVFPSIRSPMSPLGPPVVTATSGSLVHTMKLTLTVN